MSSIQGKQTGSIWDTALCFFFQLDASEPSEGRFAQARMFVSLEMTCFLLFLLPKSAFSLPWLSQLSPCFAAHMCRMARYKSVLPVLTRLAVACCNSCWGPFRVVWNCLFEREKGETKQHCITVLHLLPLALCVMSLFLSLDHCMSFWGVHTFLWLCFRLCWFCCFFQTPSAQISLFCRPLDVVAKRHPIVYCTRSSVYISIRCATV